MKKISCFLFLLILLLLASCSSSVSESSASDNNPDNLEKYLSSFEYTTGSSTTMDESTIISPAQNSSQLSIDDAYNKYKSALNSFSELISFNSNSETVILVSGVAEFNITCKMSAVKDNEKTYMRSQTTNVLYDNNSQLSDYIFCDKYSDGESTFSQISTNSSKETISEAGGAGLEDLMYYISSFDSGKIINIDTSSDNSGQKLIFTLDPISAKENIEDTIASLNYEDIRMTAYAVTAYISNDGYLTSESINVSFDYITDYKVYTGTVTTYTQISDINSKISIDIPEWLEK